MPTKNIQVMTRKSTSVRGPRRSSREESAAGHERKSAHVPVMLEEVIAALDLHTGETVVDATYGRGGHSAAIKNAAKVRLVAIDADPQAGDGVVEANFADIKKVLHALDIGSIDKAFFDLGWNMTQLSAGKGFSFMSDEPLDMSYGRNPRSGFTAAQILNTFSEKALADIFYGYGEERYARRVAASVVKRRAVKKFETTFEMAELVKDVVPPAYRHGRIHPATKTFQALRIAVNDEMGSLDKGLRGAWEILAQGGRIAVIAFHSIEDRAVKKLFQEFVKDGGRLIYKKPVVASRAEITSNPASRSAKLRAIEKI